MFIDIVYACCVYCMAINYIISLHLVSTLLCYISCENIINWNIIVVINNTCQLRVTENGCIDYEIIHNVTCHLISVFIGFFESFLRRELKKTPYTWLCSLQACNNYTTKY